MPTSTTIIISTIHHVANDQLSSGVSSIWHIIAIITLIIICLILSITIYFACKILRSRTKNQYIFRGIFDRSAKRRLKLLNVPSLPTDDPRCFKCPECQTVNEDLRSKWRAKKLERDRMMQIRDHVMLKRHRSLSRISRLPSFRTRHVFTLGDARTSPKLTSATTATRPPTLTSLATTTVNGKSSAVATTSVNTNVTLMDLTVDLSLFVDTQLADTANTFLVTADTLKTEASAIARHDSTRSLNFIAETSSPRVKKFDADEKMSKNETEVQVLNWGDLDDVDLLIRDLKTIVGGPKNSSTPNNSVEVCHF